MRSFGSLAFRQVRARRLRALLTTAGIVLGVAMILGVLLLTVTIHRTFNDLFDSVYGRTDLVVSGVGGDAVRHSTLREVRRAPEVEEAEGVVFSVFTLVDRSGEASTAPSKQLNAAGLNTRAAGLSDARTVAGRKPSHGLEIDLQESWADANGIDLGDRARLATPVGVKRPRVVGLFQFSNGLDFGGQGFARMPVAAARRVMDRPSVWDEVDVVVAGGEETIARVQADLRRRLPAGVQVDTPDEKSADVESQLQGFNAILYFFAAMALFVGGSEPEGAPEPEGDEDGAGNRAAHARPRPEPLGAEHGRDWRRAAGAARRVQGAEDGGDEPGRQGGHRGEGREFQPPDGEPECLHQLDQAERQHHAEPEPDGGPEDAQQGGLAEHRAGDPPAPGPEGAQHADLPRALEDGHVE